MDENKHAYGQPSNPDVNYQHTYEMLGYFQDEYFRRHGHFWSVLKMFFGLNIAISLLPFISGILGIEIKNTALPIIIFPIVGILVAVTSAFILRKEVESFNYVSRKKYQLSRMLPAEYQYIFKEDKKASDQANKETVETKAKKKSKKKEEKTSKEKNEEKLADKIKKSYLSYRLVWMNLSFQIVVALFSLVFCLK